MRLSIMKFVFTIIILLSQSPTYWSTLIANPGIGLISEEFPNFVDESLQHLCEEDVIFFNFSNVVISNINRNFISSPLITCLNLTNIQIENIERGAFSNLPNLTRLFLSNNRLRTLEIDFFNFKSLNELKVLVINSAFYSWSKIVQIYDKYPNLVVLSLRKNELRDLQFSPKKPPLSEPFPCTTITQKIPFPTLKYLDLSGNIIEQTNFLELLPNSLYFLDLHSNLLKSLNLNNITELFALNLNNNHFSQISNNRYTSSLIVDGLKNLNYLSISENKIDIIDSGAFQDNVNLLYLNLSANHINYLHPEVFTNLKYLRTLDLSNNKIESVPQISSEIGIHTLYINYNNITKLFSHTFAQMPKLTKLLLGQNRINNVDVNAFAHLSVLEELDLSWNMLSFLPEEWTIPLVSLKYLDISFNIFTSLESLSLTNTLSLMEIYVMMNPLEHLNVRYFESLPQNLTINLMNKSSIAKWKQEIIEDYS